MERQPVIKKLMNEQAPLTTCFPRATKLPMKPVGINNNNDDDDMQTRRLHPTGLQNLLSTFKIKKLHTNFHGPLAVPWFT